VLGEAIRRAADLARLPAGAYALTKAQLHGPTRERIAARRPEEDPRVAAMWEHPDTLAAIAGYLEGLAARR
jgi:enoyl-CoA hydratase